MISKELLSVVLGIPLPHIRYNDTTNLYEIFKEDLFNWSDGSYGRWSNLEVNIYELAHECKEWAISKEWILHEVRNLKEYIIYFGGDYREPSDDFRAETEPEAIFKACQWILDKDSK